MESIECIANIDLKARMFNCLLLNRHFIAVLERKTPDFTEYPTSTKTLA
jgi:hypothetical protein